MIVCSNLDSGHNPRPAKGKKMFFSDFWISNFFKGKNSTFGNFQVIFQTHEIYLDLFKISIFSMTKSIFGNFKFFQDRDRAIEGQNFDDTLKPRPNFFYPTVTERKTAIDVLVYLFFICSLWIFLYFVILPVSFNETTALFE